MGRVAYDDVGPVVLPVNYVVDSGTVLFRTSPYSSIGRHMPTSQAAFQVDEVEDVTSGTWSVLVQGPASFVNAADLPAPAGRPSPWREWEGSQSLHVRITPRLISGRRLESESIFADPSGE